MSAGADGHLESRLDELYATAREARSRAQGIVERAEVILREAQVAQQAYQRACSRVERLREPLLSAKRDRMPHSAYARMEARLASMPVIEQAKGILMAQRGWTVDEAFDVLR